MDSEGQRRRGRTGPALERSFFAIAESCRSQARRVPPAPPGVEKRVVWAEEPGRPRRARLPGDLLRRVAGYAPLRLTPLMSYTLFLTRLGPKPDGQRQDGAQMNRGRTSEWQRAELAPGRPACLDQKPEA